MLGVYFGAISKKKSYRMEIMTYKICNCCECDESHYTSSYTSCMEEESLEVQNNF